VSAPFSPAPGAPAFDALARALAEREPAPHSLCLRLEELTLRVRSNSGLVIDDLRGYFAPFLVPETAPADLDFLLLDGPVETPPVELATRPHLPGKRPDKERAADLPGADGGGRLVRKQATGMLFAFGGGWNIALGPCAKNRNQLVNFLCTRYMERRVAQGWVLGHAAGVVRPGAGSPCVAVCAAGAQAAASSETGARALALCGFAGMGKSTLALHLVARGCDFLSNDRVLVEPRSVSAPVLHGIPKHPRLNPGTALGNPELAPLLARALPEASRRAYSNLPETALYAVEDKYDAIIDSCFTAAGAGGSRFRLAAPLAGLVVLNWKHGGGAMQARSVELAARPDLLEALRKPPGAFYLPGALETARLTAAECLETLSGVPVLELAGGSDFSAGATACQNFLDA